jgi:hypothetical protein
VVCVLSKLESAILVPHAAKDKDGKKTRFSHEKLFRSLQVCGCVFVGVCECGCGFVGDAE